MAFKVIYNENKENELIGLHASAPYFITHTLYFKG